MTTGGLDDLFGPGAEPAADEPEAVPRPRNRSLRILANVLLVAAATAVTVAVFRWTGTRISIVLVAAAFAGLRLIMLGVAEVAPPPNPKRRADGSAAVAGAGTDALRAAVRRWEENLDRAHADPEMYSRNVLPVLAELTDERLRLRHGITRATDPRRARELVGEPLWAALHDRGRRVPKARDLETYVDALERL